MAQKLTNGNTIAFDGNSNNSNGQSTQGTPGQSSSSTGQSVTFNHNVSQSSSHNNLNTNNSTPLETGGFHPYPGTSTPLETGGFHPAPGATANSGGQSAQGADGQSASAVGQSASSVQSSSSFVTNGQASSITQPGQTITGDSATATGADGQSVNTGQTNVVSGTDADQAAIFAGMDFSNSTSTPVINGSPTNIGTTKGPFVETVNPDGSITSSSPGYSSTAFPQQPVDPSDGAPPMPGAAAEDQPAYTIPADADPDTMYATGGNTTSTEGQATQGADGQSVTATGESTTSTQSSSTVINNGQTSSVNQPGHTTAGSSSTATGTDGQSASSSTPPNLNAGTTKPYIETDHNINSGGLHITNNPDGSHSMTNGSMMMSEDADGTKHISNGSFSMTKGPDGTKTVSDSATAGGNNAEARMASDAGPAQASSGSDFPTQSSYDHVGSMNAETLKSQIQSALPQPVGGWGSSSHVPPDPASGVLGIDKNKLTNPFEAKENEKDD